MDYLISPVHNEIVGYRFDGVRAHAVTLGDVIRACGSMGEPFLAVRDRLAGVAARAPPPLTDACAARDYMALRDATHGALEVLQRQYQTVVVGAIELFAERVHRLEEAAGCPHVSR